MIIVYHPAVSFSSNILGKCCSLNIFFSRTVFSSFPHRLRNISSVCAEFFAFSFEQSPGVMTLVFEYLAFSVEQARKGAFPHTYFPSVFPCKSTCISTFYKIPQLSNRLSIFRPFRIFVCYYRFLLAFSPLRHPLPPPDCRFLSNRRKYKKLEETARSCCYNIDIKRKGQNQMLFTVFSVAVILFSMYYTRCI